MEKRLIPVDGKNPYANHPGFDAQQCFLQYTVTQVGSYGNLEQCGFGCSATGGHCLPKQECESIRVKERDRDELLAGLNLD